MKALLKAMLVLALLFASTFVVIKLSGVLTLEDVSAMLDRANEVHWLYLVLTVVLLLFVDLFVAIPTMTVALLAGYFLGWGVGSVAVVTGFYLAGVTGYLLSRRYGWGLLKRIHRDDEKLLEMHDIFSRYGPLVLIICRALPILPEVSCCMAGATRMRFMKFISAFSLGTLPYALIVTYAGSISTIEKPMPAIMTAIAISGSLWLAWFVLGKRVKAERLGSD